jgi:hypothetical protein
MGRGTAAMGGERSFAATRLSDTARRCFIGQRINGLPMAPTIMTTQRKSAMQSKGFPGLPERAIGSYGQ